MIVSAIISTEVRLGSWDDRLVNPVRTSPCNSNSSAKHLVVEIEDNVIRPVFWSANAIEDRAGSDHVESPALLAGQKVDGELSEDIRNPLRGWRWA